MFRNFPDILSVPQVAEALCIGQKAAYALVNENKLGHIRIGKTIKVPKQILIEYVLATARMNIEL